MTMYLQWVVKGKLSRSYDHAMIIMLWVNLCWKWCGLKMLMGSVCYGFSIKLESPRANMRNSSSISMLGIVMEWLVMNDFVNCHMPNVIDLCCNVMLVIHVCILPISYVAAQLLMLIAQLTKAITMVMVVMDLWWLVCALQGTCCRTWFVHLICYYMMMLMYVTIAVMILC